MITNDSDKRVLVGSPVHQRPEILKEFLYSIQHLQHDRLKVSYMFIDDNENEESSKLLEQFKGNHDLVHIEKSHQVDSYTNSEERHTWNETLIWKVAGFKNQIIALAQRNQFDYLFLIDSDLVLEPPTLEHLISRNKEVISEIFWTSWEPDLPELPQVWMSDQYNLHPIMRGKTLTKEELAIQQFLFLRKLRQPGVYEVGGLGGCTLINKQALDKGVSFDEIKNVSFIGEDRHFCIRASALGIPLYVDTNYPAFHIYRLSDLERRKKDR